MTEYGPVLHFLSVFAVLFGVLLWISFTRAFEEMILMPWLALNADLSAQILDLLGFGTSAEGVRLFSSEFSLQIRQGCDGYGAWALFVSTLLAFPASGSAKVLGLLVGTICICAMNLIRIMSLFWIGVNWADLFEIFHVDVWQPVFILVSLLLFMIWAMKVSVPAANSPTQGG